jgi:hypothetical protein
MGEHRIQIGAPDMYKAAFLLGCLALTSGLIGCGSSTPPPLTPATPAATNAAAGAGDGYSAPTETESTAGAATPSGSVGTQTQYPDDGAAAAMGATSGPPAYGANYGGRGQEQGPDDGYVPPPQGSGTAGYSAFGGEPNSDGYGAQPGFPGNNPANARRAPAKKVTYKDRSIAAFQAGNTRRAYHLLAAQALVSSDEQATELISNYRWASHRTSKRPILGLNIAIGATIKNPRNVSDLSPIGSDNNAAGGGGGFSEGYGGMPSGSGSGNAQDKKTFAEISGELGRKLAAAFTEKHTDGVWSPYFQEYSLSRGRPGTQNQMNGGFGQEYGPGDGSFQTGGFSPQGGDAPFFQRPGGFGSDPYGAESSGANFNSPNLNGPASADVALPAGYSVVAPGLIYIGVGDQSKLVKKATQEGFDCLLLFELDIRQVQTPSGTKTANDTRIRALLPREAAKDVKSIGATKTLNNMQVAKAKSAGTSDGVDEAIELLIKKLEENLPLASFQSLSPTPPELTFDYVTKQRIPQLLEDKDKDMSVMDRLSEVNFFYLKGFIDETERSDAFEKIAGQNGLAVLSGSLSDKTKALDKIIERDFK